jgi:hypothetical protein
MVMYYDGGHAALARLCDCGAGTWLMFESKCGESAQIEHVFDQLDESTNGYGARCRYYW